MDGSQGSDDDLSNRSMEAAVSSEEEESVVEEYDLRSILRILISTGRISAIRGGVDRLYTEEADAEGTGDDTSLEEDELEYVSSMQCSAGVGARTRKTSSPAGMMGRNAVAMSTCPLRGDLAATELGQELSRACGRFAPYNVTQLINSRKRLASRGWSTPEQVAVSTKYLPNWTPSEPLTNLNCRIFCGRYSDDGSFFLSASQDDYIRVYDTTQDRFKLKTQISAKAVGWAVLDTALSHDNNKVAYSSWCHSIYMVNLHQPTWHQELPLDGEGMGFHNFCVFSLTFSHDSDEILCGSNRGKIFIYNVARGSSYAGIRGHGDADLGSVKFADDSSHILFSAGDDGVCKVWDRRELSTADPRPVGKFVGHRCGITSIDSKGDGRYLLTNSKDQTMKLWDMRKFSPKATKAHIVRWDYRYRPVPAAFASPVQYDFDTSLMTYRGHRVMSTLIRCYFSPIKSTGQQFVYVGSQDGKVYVYDLLTGTPEMVLEKAHQECVRDCSWHPYEDKLISTSFDGVVREWRHSHSAHVRTHRSPSPPKARRQRHEAGATEGPRIRRHTAAGHVPHTEHTE